MASIPYDRIGNVPEVYKHEPRVVENHGLVVTECNASAIKFYSMLRKENVGKRDIESAKELVRTDMERNIPITPQIGMGFAILSEDMLNVARWNVEYPIVLNNDIYTYENADIRTAAIGDVRNLGSFCIWELGIVNHERDAWKRYLESPRLRDDKHDYLMDFMQQGELS